MGFDRIDNLSSKSFKEACQVRVAREISQFSGKENSIINVSVVFSSQTILPKPTSEITQEDIEDAKKELYQYLTKPALSDEQFKMLQNQIMRMRY